MSRSRRVGTAAESAVVAYLRSAGWPYAERRALNGARDRGDVAGVPGVVVEVKAARVAELAAWLNELSVEISNDGAAYGAVWWRRRGRSDPGDWYVLMDGRGFTDLLRAALDVDQEPP